MLTFRILQGEPDQGSLGFSGRAMLGSNGLPLDFPAPDIHLY